MLLSQVAAQQLGCPNRRVIAEVTRVRINDRIDERIDDALNRGRATDTCAIGQAFDHRERGALLKAPSPVVDGLARDAQSEGDLFDALAFIKEKDSHGALIETRISVASQQLV